jgi:6-phosphogluconolactonase
VATTRLELDVYPTDAEAFEASAERVAERLRDAVGRGRAAVALSGGRGGRGVMLALAARDDMPWDRIEWYWVDERCVPATDPRSNVKLARDSLLDKKVAAERVHPPPVELEDPERVAAAYGETLVSALGSPPVFDVVLLGLGDNAHTASLMPGGAALHAPRPVVAVPVADVTTDPLVARVTITPPVLRAARAIVLTTTGADKAKAVAASLGGPDRADQIPGQLVRPSERIHWIVDRAAAGDLLRTAEPAR